MKVIKFLFNSTKEHHKLLLLIMLMMLLVAVDSNCRPLIIKWIIDGIAGKAEYSLWFLCALYAAMQCILISAWWVYDYLGTKFSSVYRGSVVKYFIEKLYDYSYVFFQSYQSGSIISRIVDAFSTSNRIIHVFIYLLWHYFLQIIICLIVLSTVSKLFAISVMIWLIVFLSLSYFGFKLNNSVYKNFAEKRANVLGFVGDFITNVFNIKIYTNKQHELNKLEKFNDELKSATIEQGFYIMRLNFALGVITSIYAISFIIFLIKGYYRNIISPGDLALVVMVNFNIIHQTFNLFHSLMDFVVDWGALDKAISIIEQEPEIRDKNDASELKVDNGEIRFEKVNFNYKETAPLFKNKSVIIYSKQKVGLVGYSGAGKSTFVNLIMRFYSLELGAITIDSQDISLVTQDSLRKNIAYIPQEPLLFHRSIIDNIRYGKIDASKEEVIEAAKKAAADEFINSLPKGYDSMVGDRGVKLSGGQRQRIVIARAFLKNAPILILDEATSQLDSITESHIQDSLHSLMQDKTTIVVAHRLSTLLTMDRILVFSEGEIVQDGTHQDLVTKEGLYKAMWEAQVGGFLPERRGE